MFGRLLQKKEGYSLLEILLSLTISGVIFALVSSFYTFSSDTFAIGENQTQIQQDIRIINSFIPDKVNNTVELKVLNSLPASFDSNYTYIYRENNSIKYVTGTTIKTFYSGHISSLQYKIIKKYNDTGNYDYLLQYNIEASKEGQNYQLKGTTLLNNIQKISINKEGNIICFKNPI